MITLGKDSKVYVLCPAGIATGGPENLHQLAFSLRKELGIDAYLYYIPPNHPSPVPKPYEIYQVPFVRQIEDSKLNVLISPEADPLLNIMKQHGGVKKAIWWLSVDNYFLDWSSLSSPAYLLNRLILSLSMKFFKRPLTDIEKRTPRKRGSSLDAGRLPDVLCHLVQSKYAESFLVKNGINPDRVAPLSDYLNEDVLRAADEPSVKTDVVLYNPMKGYSFTRRIISSAENTGIKARFTAIWKMTRNEVIETLKRAKVYMDFGNHPGKDRIPREAAIMRCCVITGRRGSAAYHEDVPIPDEFKFEDKNENIPLIVEKIRDCLENHEERLGAFEPYRMHIRNQKSTFMEELKRIVDNPLYESARGELGRFAELVKSPEHVHAYRVTPLSLWNAAAGGMDADAVLAVLERFSRYPVPQNVACEIR